MGIEPKVDDDDNDDDVFIVMTATCGLDCRMGKYSTKWILHFIHLHCNLLHAVLVLHWYLCNYHVVGVCFSNRKY